MDMDIGIISQYMGTFLIILLRAGIFVSLLPVIGGQQLPPQFRIGMAVFISMLLTPVVNVQAAEDQLPMIIIREVMFGGALGLTVRLIFLGINIAGVFTSHIMGMSIGQVFNPDLGASTHIAEVFGVMTMLTFLIMNAHHDLIYIFVKSFEFLPAGKINILALVPEMINLGSKMFILALKIASPMMAGILISNVLTGLLSKTAPQLNIFFITMPLNIFIGFLLIILSIPAFEYVLNVKFTDLRGDMTRILMLAER